MLRLPGAKQSRVQFDSEVLMLGGTTPSVRSPIQGDDANPHDPITIAEGLLHKRTMTLDENSIRPPLEQNSPMESESFDTSSSNQISAQIRELKNKSLDKSRESSENLFLKQILEENGGDPSFDTKNRIKKATVDYFDSELNKTLPSLPSKESSDSVASSEEEEDGFHTNNFSGRKRFELRKSNSLMSRGKIRKSKLHTLEKMIKKQKNMEVILGLDQRVLD